MTSNRFTRKARLKRAAIVPALALAAISANLVQAQTPGSVQDFRLPTASPTPSPTPTAAGPVDTDHPVAMPSRPAPTATPLPTITPPAPATTQPAPQPSASATRPVRRAPQVAPSAIPVSPPSQIASPPAATDVATAAAPVVEANESAPTVEQTAAASPEPAKQQSPWPWIVGGLALVAVLGAFLLKRRRAEAEPEEVEEEAVFAESAQDHAEPSPPATLPTPRSQPAEPAPVAPSPPPPAAPPQPATGQRPIEIALEARHLSRAMVNATLAYRLTVTNTADAALGPLKVSGDIITAHASLSAQDQLVPADAALAAIHQVAGLAPGESTTFSGELRLPLASILPMRSGSARVFVPLARFRVEDGDTVATRVFVVGQASDQPGGALRPFPLDRGPGVDRTLGQRELEVPA